MRLTTKSRLVTIATFIMVQAVHASLPWVRVDPARRRLVNEQGSEVVFHGVNVVAKLPPYHPQTDKFDPVDSLVDRDIQDMRAMGANVVRLLVALPGVFPARGQVNETYLDKLVEIVDLLALNGIYTILDAHQDLFSPKFCGNGFPDWATPYTNVSESTRPEKFPIPTAWHEYEVDADTGYPLASECHKSAFFRYYFADAVGKAFQAFYDNYDGIQDEFVKFWGVVAKRFASKSSVIGYEILNEPFLGDILQHPELLDIKQADKINLKSLYSKVHDAVRAEDDRHILFFESTVGVSQTPFKSISGTGLPAGPGGEEYNDRQVFSYHVYCFYNTRDGQPANTEVCNSYYDKYLSNVIEGDLNKLSVAGFLTEWGAMIDDGPVDRAMAEKIGELADRHVQSWTYWQFKSFRDPTTQAMEPDGTVEEGFYNETDSSLREGKVKLIARTYPQQVAGNISSFFFDPPTGNFQLVFSSSGIEEDATVIFASRRWVYPLGVEVQVSPDDAMLVSLAGDSILLHTRAGLQAGTEISVSIARKPSWHSIRKRLEEKLARRQMISKQ
mmetsp:Transcript_29831/g.67479  ORF Transcript_29831/g.67479 Transcript_29831/m.67479 type:complete len:557 (-) Transcript_29831:193-1863(-)